MVLSILPPVIGVDSEGTTDMNHVLRLALETFPMVKYR